MSLMIYRPLGHLRLILGSNSAQFCSISIIICSSFRHDFYTVIIIFAQFRSFFGHFGLEKVTL